MNETERYPLRPEALKIREWDRLTRHQRVGLVRLLRMLREGVGRLNSDHVHDHRMPWLSQSRYSQAAFVDGKRGTGKTTLMTTLVDVVSNADPFAGSTGKTDAEQLQLDNVKDLAQSLRRRLIILEPLDMEPLPEGTPILAAILARLNSAASRWGNRGRRSLLDEDERGRVRFRQFQTRIARALQSNLGSRQGSLDSEQFAQAVMEQEEDRLEIRARLEEALIQLSRSLGGSESDSQGDQNGSCHHLFLVPIDDVDLKPDRCLELLRVVRAYSPPPLFFLLMGQFELVESIVKLQVSRSYQDVRGGSHDLSAVSEKVLQKQLAEVATANLQKMIPDVIPLPEIPLTEVLGFRPLEYGGSNATLGDLFEKVEFSNPEVFAPAECDGNTEAERITNLRELVELSGPLPDSIEVLRLGNYAGVGAFQVSARRLVDLWRDLLGVSQGTANGPTAREVFLRHWKRVIDEDPMLSLADRDRLRRDGFAACEVVDADEPEFRELLVEEGRRDVQEATDRKGAEILSYQPYLQIAEASAESGIPHLRLRGRHESTDGPEAAGLVCHRRTRCAYVLLHDLALACKWPAVATAKRSKISSIRAVSMAWRTPEDSSIVVGWPEPDFSTFQKLAWFQRTLSLVHGKSGASSSSSPNSIEATELDRLIREWIYLGNVQFKDKRRSQPEWDEVASWDAILNHLESVAGSEAGSAWLEQVALLVMPEACAVRLADPEERDVGDEVLKRIPHFDDKPTQQRLRYARGQQLETFWSSDHRQLWRELNGRHEEAQIALPARLPAPDVPSPVARELKEFRSDIRRQLRRSESKMGREFQLAQIRSSIQQGLTAREDNAQTAKVFFAQARDAAQELSDGNPKDRAIARQLTLASSYLGDVYLQLHQLERALEMYTRGLAIAERLTEEKPSDMQTQRDLSVYCNRVGDVLLRRNELERALEMYTRALAIAEQLAEEKRGDAQAQRDLGVSCNKVGNVHLQRNQLERALEAYKRSLAIAEHLAEEKPSDTEAERDLGVCFNSVGNVHLRRNQLERALEMYTRALAIAERLAEEKRSDAQAQRDLSVCCNSVGNVHLRRNQLERALEMYTRALAIAERLDKEKPGDSQTQRDLSVYCSKAGDVHLRRNQLERALEMHELALAIAERLAEEKPGDWEAQRDLSEYCCKVGDAHVKLEQLEEARANYTRGLALSRELVADSPEAIGFPLLLAELLWKLSQLVDNAAERGEMRKEARTILAQQRDRNDYFYPGIEEIESELRNIMDSGKGASPGKKRKTAPKKATKRNDTKRKATGKKAPKTKATKKKAPKKKAAKKSFKRK